MKMEKMVITAESKKQFEASFGEITKIVKMKDLMAEFPRYGKATAAFNAANGLEFDPEQEVPFTSVVVDALNKLEAAETKEDLQKEYTEIVEVFMVIGIEYGLKQYLGLLSPEDIEMIKENTRLVMQPQIEEMIRIFNTIEM